MTFESTYPSCVSSRSTSLVYLSVTPLPVPNTLLSAKPTPHLLAPPARLNLNSGASVHESRTRTSTSTLFVAGS